MNHGHTESKEESTAVKTEVLGSADELLAMVRAVSGGDFSRRLEVKYPDTHPVGALATGINTMIDALQEARTQSTEHSDRLAEQVATIERQQAAIQELSTPVIEVWTGVLCVPIVGVLDSARATDLTSTLLHTITQKKAPFTIIDITGIEVMDTSTADHFIRMARSVGLLGAKCVLSGIRPNIARTIVHMGIDLTGIESYRTLREALRSYVRARIRLNANRQNNRVEDDRDHSSQSRLSRDAQERARTKGSDKGT
jgi:rsbT co-antagonist protein RsbR